MMIDDATRLITARANFCVGALSRVEDPEQWVLLAPEEADWSTVTRMRFQPPPGRSSTAIDGAGAVTKLICMSLSPPRGGWMLFRATERSEAKASRPMVVGMSLEVRPFCRCCTRFGSASTTRRFHPSCWRAGRKSLAAFLSWQLGPTEGKGNRTASALVAVRPSGRSGRWLSCETAVDRR